MTPNQGYMQENKIYIPSLWCDNIYCVFEWHEEETTEDLSNRYPELKSFYGTIEDTMYCDSLKLEEENEDLYGVLYEVVVYDIQNDLNGNSFFLLHFGDMQYSEGDDIIKNSICLPRNVFFLRKFYIENILPIQIEKRKILDS